MVLVVVVIGFIAVSIMVDEIQLPILTSQFCLIGSYVLAEADVVLLEEVVIVESGAILKTMLTSADNTPLVVGNIGIPTDHINSLAI